MTIYVFQAFLSACINIIPSFLYLSSFDIFYMKRILGLVLFLILTLTGCGGKEYAFQENVIDKITNLSIIDLKMDGWKFDQNTIPERTTSTIKANKDSKYFIELKIKNDKDKEIKISDGKIVGLTINYRENEIDKFTEKEFLKYCKDYELSEGVGNDLEVVNIYTTSIKNNKSLFVFGKDGLIKNIIIEFKEQ